MEVDVGREHIGQLRCHRVGQTGFVGGAEQRIADGAAGQARLRSVRRLVHAGAPAAVFAAHQAQAREVGRELVGLLTRVACHQVLQRAVGRSTGLNHLASAAGQDLAREIVGAQEERCRRVAHTQAHQQRFGRVGGAGDLVACERKFLRSQCVQLRLQADWLYGFAHQALWQTGCVGHHRRDGDGGDGGAAQQGHDAEHQTGAVALAEAFDVLRCGNGREVHASVWSNCGRRAHRAPIRPWTAGRVAAVTRRCSLPHRLQDDPSTRIQRLSGQIGPLRQRWRKRTRSIAKRPLATAHKTPCECRYVTAPD